MAHEFTGPRRWSNFHRWQRRHGGSVRVRTYYCWFDEERNTHVLSIEYATDA